MINNILLNLYMIKYLINIQMILLTIYNWFFIFIRINIDKNNTYICQNMISII